MDNGFTENFLEHGRLMARYVDDLGMDARQVVQRQSGLWAMTLAKVTPPKDPVKTRQHIKESVTGKFAMLEDVSSADFIRTNSKNGTGEVIWYMWTPVALLGVGRDLDKRHSEVDELERIYYGTTKSGRSLLGSRGKQKIYILQRILTKASQVKELMAKLVNHVGRLKAGWLKSWRKAGAPGKIPQYVLAHEAQSKGYFIDQLGQQNNPSFTMVNFAPGANARNCGFAMQATAKIRAKALRVDLALRVQGKKDVNAL